MEGLVIGKPMVFYAEVSFLTVVIILILISLATDHWDVAPCCHQGRTRIMKEEGSWASVSFHSLQHCAAIT